MPRLDNIPEVRVVDSFEALIATPFSGSMNALCWRRSLEGDFDEVANALSQSSDGVTLECEEALLDLELSPAGQLARETLIEDLKRLKELDLSPSLDCIPTYARDENSNPITTDVYSFHVDSSPIEVDTYLCSYNVACSEGLRNVDAIRRVDDVNTRQELLNIYGGDDDVDFETFLEDNFYDLHYCPSSALVEPYLFGIGHLWRIATLWPGRDVLPCIHRAPDPTLVKSPRLLLIS